MELQKIKTVRYVWHMAHRASYDSFREKGLLAFESSNSLVFAHQRLRDPMRMYPLIFDGICATIVDELNTMAVRIDTHRLKRDWYLDPYRFEIEWTSEKGDWSHFNLSTYVCTKGTISPEYLDFFEYGIEREKPEFRYRRTEGAAHISAIPYGQEFRSLAGCPLYMKPIKEDSEWLKCA